MSDIMSDWLKTAIFYQVYPQSFQDSNGDGIGDLLGLVSRLDYIRSLGVNALWLNPVFESPFMDAGYDITDYRRIARRYGTNADAKRLFAEAHKRGMKVVLDLVAGHTSDRHPWFVQSSGAKGNEFSDRYIWTSSRKTRPKGFVAGSGTRNGCYKPNFFDCQPALNYGYGKTDPAHPWEQPTDAPGSRATLAELREIMAYWLDRGCDGFRVDMAASLVKNDPGLVETCKLWNGIRNDLCRKYPGCVLISEWGNPKEAVAAGFHVDFMLHFGVPGYPSLFFNEKGVFHKTPCYFDRRGKGAYAEFYQNWREQFEATRGRGYIAVPSANHDFQRPNCGPRDASQLRVVWAFLMTWPGIPFIYYGDEIGMRFIEGLPDKEGSVLVNFGGVNRAGTRTPMQWDASANAGFSSASPEQLYLPVDPDPERPDVAAQEKDTKSLLNFIRKLVKFRKSNPAVGNCTTATLLSARNRQYPFIYLREGGGERFIVALNPSGRTVKATVSLSGVSRVKPQFVDKTTATVADGKIIFKMEGVSFGIYQVKSLASHKDATV